ncbi:MAG TPA: carbon monoxide dehydrogenase, partial [Desulfitobacterium dehalogenans]|nr:carbon monoxide dehydrogenase [Desulfitobacterium dehalogenans]
LLDMSVYTDAPSFPKGAPGSQLESIYRKLIERRDT